MKTIADFRAAIEKAISAHSEEQQRFLRDHLCLDALDVDTVHHLMARALKVSAPEEITSYHIDGMEVICDGEHKGSGTTTTSFGDGEVIDGIFLCEECAAKAKQRQAEIDLHDDDIPTLEDLVHVTYDPYGRGTDKAFGYVRIEDLHDVEDGQDIDGWDDTTQNAPDTLEGWIIVRRPEDGGIYAVEKEAIWTAMWEEKALRSGWGMDCPAGGTADACAPEAEAMVAVEEGDEIEEATKTVYLRKYCW